MDVVRIVMVVVVGAEINVRGHLRRANECMQLTDMLHNAGC
jgi:hypothetical protein